MSATTQLSHSLSQLSDSLKATNNLIARLSKLSFQPGSEPLSEQSNVRTELAQDIHDTLKQLEEDLQLLKQDAEDLGGNVAAHRRRESSARDRDQARLQAQVVRLDEDLRHSRSSFRKAQLSAKKASEAAKQKERELVFATLRDPAPQPSSEQPNETSSLFAGRRQLAQKSKLTKGELEVDASSNVTSALRRTHDLLSTELSRSRFAQETFDESTAALADLGEHYTNLDTILNKSKSLLGTLITSQKSDTWYLETAFYLLIATLVWLFFRRVLYGPLFKLPLFLWRTSIFVLKWALLKPLLVFLSVTGVLRPEPSSAAGRLVSSSRPPLIIQPSATGRPPRFPKDMADNMPKGGIPVGAGGRNAKVGTTLDGQMSESIGRMAAESAKPEQSGKQNEKREGVEATRRADGTVLQERGELPPNPKKKMFEADVEDQR